MNPKDQDTFRKELEAWMSGDMTAEDHAAFQDLLKKDASARDQFRRAARLDARLRELSERELLNETAEITSIPTKNDKGLAGWAVAASLVLGWLLWSGPDIEREDQAELTSPIVDTVTEVVLEKPVAVLSMQVDADWEKLEMGDDHLIRAGELKLRSGVAQLELLNGAMLIMEGAVNLTVRDRDKVICHGGNLRVQVPAQAKDFQIEGPGVSISDTDVDFGLLVDGDSTEVHVLRGRLTVAGSNEVRAMDESQALMVSGNLRKTISLKESVFVDTHVLIAQSRDRFSERQQEWQLHQEALLEDPSLVLCYDFEELGSGRRVVRDLAHADGRSHEGIVVGARRSEGRWPNATAVEFKQGSDRVRLSVDETMKSMTLMSWVRIDGFDRRWQSLMLSEHWDDGDVHWQFSDEGELIIGIQTPGSGHGQYHSAKNVIGQGDLGRWMHLAFSYDAEAGVARHFLDGREVSSHAIELHVPLTIGAADLGNWTIPDRDGWNIRNLNGRMDEFLIYSRSLGDSEIRRHFELSRPEESLGRLALR